MKLLKEKQLTISLAESITCGMASHVLNTIKGTSDVFLGSIVCYNEVVKRQLLGISGKILKKYTAESAEVAGLLAKNLSSIIPANIQIALTGLAAPGGSETLEKPIGTVFISMYYRKHIYPIRELFKGSPLQIKRQACHSMLELINSVIFEREPNNKKNT